MKSFLSGRPRHDQPTLRPGTQAAVGLQKFSPARACGSGSKKEESTVQCVKEGDKVVRLIITCSCGERIEVDCLYPTGG